MSQTHGREYSHLSLKELASRLSDDYYQMLSILLPKASEKLNEIKSTEIDGSIINYTDACETLISAVGHHVAHFTNSLLPYLDELHEKNTTGHNCSTCSGQCDMGHSSQLMILTEAHLQITSLLYNVQKYSSPFYVYSHYPPVYQSLRNEMLVIDDLLKELFSVEETHLISRIITSQRNINAHR